MTEIMEMATDEIEIPRDMLPRVPRAIGMSTVYALSRNLIGISFHPVDEWKARSLWHGYIKFQETDNSLIFLLLQNMASFYRIYPKSIEISVSEKTGYILVSVEKPTQAEVTSVSGRLL